MTHRWSLILLRDNEVAVMLKRVHTLPRFAEDDVDYAVPTAETAGR
jgi:hypothetical protein